MQSEPTKKFERFSDDIRHAMRIANREAKWQLHPCIDTPHLLIALLKEKTGLAGILLRRRGITARSARRRVSWSLPRERSFHLFAKLPLSTPLRQVIDEAVRHAVAERHDSVGTGGILLAMVCHDPKTSEVLKSLSIKVHDLEKDLSRYLHQWMVVTPGEPLYLDESDPQNC